MSDKKQTSPVASNVAEPDAVENESAVNDNPSQASAAAALPQITQKRLKSIINIIYFAIIIGFAIFAFRYAIFAIMPFFIAFIIATIVRPLVRLLTERLRFKRGLASVLVLVLFYATVGILAVFIGVRIALAAKDLFLKIPAVYTDTIEPAVINMFDSFETFVKKLDPTLVTVVEDMSVKLTDSLGSTITSFSLKLVSSITGYISSIPNMLISTLIMIISSFFMTADYKLITTFVLKQFSERTAGIIIKAKDSLGAILGEYAKSYLLIMLITFAELFVGISLVGFKNAALIALVITVFDILPVVGSGLIMFPWAVTTLIQGNLGRGLGLLAVWLVIIIVRNVIEPRIIGHHVGMHPIITLMAMILGVKLFGGIGLFALPIMLAIIKRMHDQGSIKLYRSLTEQEKADIAATPPAAPKKKK